ncbi:MAG: hypothetical protein RMK81_13545, partial [Geminicoccaceae bacterium]|nr:hypothetical protein [Geminicoccaceae bacterium]
DALHRPIRSTFRLADSRRLAVDTGNGFHTIDLASPASRAFSGDRVLRAIGWRRGHGAFLWRIRDDAATSFTLLAAQTELKVNE